jgi:hypothetical protein
MIMTSQELKDKLISKIRQIQNDELLEEMFRLVTTEEADLNVYELSEDQLNAVEEAQKQFKNGQFLSGNQADNEIEKWLGK